MRALGWSLALLNLTEKGRNKISRNQEETNDDQFDTIRLILPYSQETLRKGTASCSRKPLPLYSSSPHMYYNHSAPPPRASLIMIPVRENGKSEPPSRLTPTEFINLRISGNSFSPARFASLSFSALDSLAFTRSLLLRLPRCIKIVPGISRFLRSDSRFSNRSVFSLVQFSSSSSSLRFMYMFATCGRRGQISVRIGRALN